jgi:hypothetical protein
LVSLTSTEYSLSHTNPRWCVVIPGHVLDDDGSTVISRQEHFWVVQLNALSQ